MRLDIYEFHMLYERQISCLIFTSNLCNWEHIYSEDLIVKLKRIKLEKKSTTRPEFSEKVNLKFVKLVKHIIFIS